MESPNPSPAQFLGRSFEINGQVIWPCEVCATPIFPYKQHVCVGLDDHVLGFTVATWEQETEAA